VTGGGLSNLLRLHPTLGWRIDAPLPVLPEFTWLQEAGGVETREMYRTFNMGMGMVLAVDAAYAEGVAAWLAERMPGSAVVGTVVSDAAPSVVHVPSGSTFSHY
jgi:phosphoribosylformylglycinamidine cyclo-ligase